MSHVHSTRFSKLAWPVRRYKALLWRCSFPDLCIFWLLDPGAQAVRESTAEQDQTVAAGPSALCGPIGAAGPHKRRPIYVRTARIMHNMVISQMSLQQPTMQYRSWGTSSGQLVSSHVLGAKTARSQSRPNRCVQPGNFDERRICYTVIHSEQCLIFLFFQPAKSREKSGPIPFWSWSRVSPFSAGQ